MSRAGPPGSMNMSRPRPPGSMNMSRAGPPGSTERKRSPKKEDQGNTIEMNVSRNESSDLIDPPDQIKYKNDLSDHTADEIDPNDGIEESGSNGDATDHDDHDEQNDFVDHKSEKSSVQKKNKNQNELRSSCGICGAPAADHLHYGAFCCYSCRAFFRRSGHRVYKCVRLSDDCKIESKTRRNCKKCRYRICLEAGMKPALVDKHLRERERKKSLGLETLGSSNEKTKKSPKINSKSVHRTKCDAPKHEDHTSLPPVSTSSISVSNHQTAGPPHSPVTSSISTSPYRSKLEQRKLPRVPKIEKALETTTDIGINQSDTIQFSQNTNQSSEKTNRFFANTNRSFENASQSSENTNQSSEKTNRFIANTNQSSEYESQLFENTNQSSKKINRLFENTSPSSMNKNRSSQNTNQLFANTRRSSENLSQSFENMRRSSENTNQLFANTSRSSENSSQSFENMHRSSMYTNRLSKENLFHPESWQIKAIQLNQNSGSTSFNVNSDLARAEHNVPVPILILQGDSLTPTEVYDHAEETSKPYRNWDTRETSTRLDKNQAHYSSKGSESLNKGEYYIDNTETIGYPAFSISHHKISSHMSETENPAINENSGTEALDLVKRIPEDELPSYLMDIDSHQIQSQSLQTGMMDGNLFQPLSRDPIMNMTIEENILLGQKVRSWESVVSQVWKRNTETGADVMYKNPGGLIHEAETSREGVISSSTDPSSNILVHVLDTQGILQQRICCTTLLAIAVRMFGGPKHQFFPDDQMVKDTFYLKYSYLLRSPWAPTLTEENMVISTMKETGYLLGPDRVLEVLFTNCLMVGFNMDSSQEEYLHTLGAKEDILPRNQALLLYRYLKNSMGTVHARALYSRLEVLVHKLEAAAQIFFNHRLMI